MRIGYACTAIGVPNTDLKSCILRNASEEKILELTAHNLSSLETMIDYNIANDIRLFRISSGLIPFGSEPSNTVPWWDRFEERFLQIGDKIRKSAMRVSMHPGQYTVLNSPNENTVLRSVADLLYHTKVLDMLGCDRQHKIILHIGGIYGDKEQAKLRFIDNFGRLPESIRQRIILENDDKLYHIQDVLEIAEKIGTPVVFDVLHHTLNPPETHIDPFYWIKECRKTFSKDDGMQKIHYSQQDQKKSPGAHSQSIRIVPFLDFYRQLDSPDMDIMLEVKDKNLSAIKCINCTTEKKDIHCLKAEWSRYQYSILERSPAAYEKMQDLLTEKNLYLYIDFYMQLETALACPVTTENAVNTAICIWKHFEKSASEKEQKSFSKALKNYSEGKVSLESVKNLIWKQARKYAQDSLLHSYYFSF